MDTKTKQNEDSPSPFQLGYKEGSRFGCTPSRNPWKDETEEGTEWNKGYHAADQRAQDRAFSLLTMGWSCGVLHADNPQAWAHLIGHLVATNGQAMATVFLGAEMRHARIPLVEIGSNPRKIYELAAAAAQGQECPLVKPALERLFKLTLKIREYFVAEDKVDGHEGAKTYSVRVDAMLDRIIWGDSPPPEQPTIIGATSADMRSLPKPPGS